MAAWQHTASRVANVDEIGAVASDGHWVLKPRRIRWLEESRDSHRAAAVATETHTADRMPVMAAVYRCAHYRLQMGRMGGPDKVSAGGEFGGVSGGRRERYRDSEKTTM